MFPVIVIVPSSNTINLFLYVLLCLLVLFMPAKTTPPYSKTLQQQHLHHWLFMAQSILSNWNVTNFLNIFRAFVRFWTYFGLPEVLFVSVVWHCVTLDSHTAKRTGTSIVTRWRRERYIPSMAPRPILVVAWKLNFVCKIDKYSKQCLLWT